MNDRAGALRDFGRPIFFALAHPAGRPLLSIETRDQPMLLEARHSQRRLPAIAERLAERARAAVRKSREFRRTIPLTESYGIGLRDLGVDEEIILDGGAIYVHSPLGFLGGSMGRLVLTNRRLIFLSLYVTGSYPGQALAPRFSFQVDDIRGVELGGWKLRLRGKIPGVSVFAVAIGDDEKPYVFQLSDAARWVDAIRRRRGL